ncbi:hypothetical protein cyc_07302 [Cyclospora cayetanensis]|uniref:Uncharacterized protein n=1 Tax=Cyclospora cayetanensis TaxID=88456 RepID=A0A1D3CWI9_9EIME|nr:hypothetical protein cyc_07302 [Cyclospora cayetanensis]
MAPLAHSRKALLPPPRKQVACELRVTAQGQQTGRAGLLKGVQEQQRDRRKEQKRKPSRGLEGGLRRGAAPTRVPQIAWGRPRKRRAPPPQTEASSSSSGTGSSEAAAATPAPQEKLQQDQHAAPRPARPLHAPLTPARGYREDAQASRRGVFAAGLAEVKFNLKPNAALLQMPVAVSTVSTAHSSATVSDFCHGPSQPIEGAVEEGSWRTEAAPGSAADTCLQKLEKQREGKDGKQHEATGLKLVDPTPTDVPKEAVSGQAPLGQSAGGAENLRRDTSNACCIQ